ncbi:type I-C CRISPR-associated protein Cas5c [Thiolapillus sp.]|uniref:type I-C CRISPR-associated protein Cas5c n=1 Tax=Thiolapillus sp. TaxID=2017437 RepID=UPI0025E5CFEC|nr:type I-C CRISPR-associated protein Cas5c [Thiolapillus sp.]
MKTYCLEVRGDFACFTRPEMKVERVSYDVITPSAARAVFDAILWKPPIRWRVTRIEVLAPIRWINLRRNELGGVVSKQNVRTAMKNGKGHLGVYIEDDRQQRAGLFLRDVRYRLHAHFELLNKSEGPEKYAEMFQRRACKGQCFSRPYLGCREFSADFRLVEPGASEPAPIDEIRDLGWMLYDLDYRNPDSPSPRFFQARMKNGVIEVPSWDSEEVRG